MTALPQSATQNATSTVDFERDLQGTQMRIEQQASRRATSQVIDFEQRAASLTFKRGLDLDPSERTRLIHLLAESLGADAPSLGVERTPGVCGGAACLVRTRIPVWSIVSYLRQGASDATLLENFPTLRRSDLNSARLYAQAYPGEIEREIRENELGG